MEMGKEEVPPIIKAIIAAALARYLRDEKFSFKVVTIKPVQLSQINFWGLEGRRLNMIGLKRLEKPWCASI